MKTYGDIYNEFCDKFPHAEVEDYRPAGNVYVPQLSEYIPNAIIVWLKDGTKVIYIARSEDEPQESEEAQPKQTDGNCLDFDFDKVKETLKKDDLDNLIVDHTCEQARDEKMIDAIDFAIKATDSQDDYSMGMRNGMRYVKSLIDGKKPQYESRRTNEEIKLGIDLGDEVVGDYGGKGVVVGIDTYNDEVWLVLLMRNHKVPQHVKASGYKTKTGRHFPQITEVLEQMKGESDGK